MPTPKRTPANIVLPAISNNAINFVFIFLSSLRHQIKQLACHIQMTENKVDDGLLMAQLHHQTGGIQPRATSRHA